MDMYKLNDILWEDLRRQEELRPDDAFFDIWEKNLVLIGVRLFRVWHDQKPHDLICDVIRIGLENADCVLVTRRNFATDNVIYAIPRELAEKILVLGAMPPIEELAPSGQLSGQGRI